nr:MULTISPECIES: DUF3089 domain-containing protein [unclassified Ruminococcus]
MTKKRISLIMSAVILLLFLASCAQNETPAESIYSDKNNWAYFAQGENKNADLFLICPTVYSGSDDSHNMSLNDANVRASFYSALNMEKGIYENDCRMFAPYYRQAGLNVYLMSAIDREQYLEKAYKDVKEAFIYYMENLNDNRPYILAGFSQGADMTIRLMKDLFDDEKYSKNLIANYAIGWYLTNEEVKEYPQLKPARGETDTGVIITFNSEDKSIKTSVIVEDKTLGINPLNWKTDSTAADKSLNLGACFTNYNGEIIKEIKNFTGAYLDPDRGTLKVTDINKADYPSSNSLFPDGVYHIYDYQFFYRNLQKNVGDRIGAFLEN